MECFFESESPADNMKCIKLEATEGGMEFIKSEVIEGTVECIKSEEIEVKMESIPPVSTEDECVVANSSLFMEFKNQKEEFNAHYAEPPLKKMKEDPDNITGSSSTKDSHTLALPIEFVGVKRKSSLDESSSDKSSSRESFSEEFSSSDDDHDNQQRVR